METSDARQANRSAVFAAIVAAGETTRTRVCEVTGLSPATVSRVADRLLAEGMITEGSQIESSGRGRNAVSLAARADLGLVCGIDVGGTNCRFLLANMLGEPVAVIHESTPVSIGASALAEWLASRAVRLTADVTGPLRAVVVGLPGMVTPDGTTVSGAPNVPQIEGQVFARKLARAIPAPVLLYNDSDLALVGELRFGAGRGLTRAVMFTIGAGLGAGVALDGALLRGRTGLTGEFGYLPAGPSGETVEELLSGTGLMRQATALRAGVSDAAEVFAPAAETLLAPVLERFDRALLLALTAATVAYEPEAIILGGGLSPAIARRLDVVRRRLGELVPATPDLRLAELGDLSGTLGALAVACQTAYEALGVSASDAASLPPAGPLARLWDDKEAATHVRRVTPF
jgi:predicted NBD/HSP70 family sugar kinase